MFLTECFLFDSIAIMKNTRQGKWQDNKRKQGLCSCCGERTLSEKSTWYCDVCLAQKYYKRNERKQIKGYSHSDPDRLLAVIEN